MEERTIKVAVFSGEQADWRAWKIQWRARATMRGYWEICTGKMNVPRESTDRLSEKQETARKANDKGFSDLILSMDPKTETGKMMINMIASAETEECFCGLHGRRPKVKHKGIASQG